MTLKKGVRCPEGKDLLVGQGATIVGPIRGGQSVFLSKNVVVRGRIDAPIDIVVGAHSLVEGDVVAGSNVLALEGARIRGEVRAGGRVRLLGADVKGPVDAKGDVDVRGEGAALRIHAGGRVRSLPGPEAAP